MTRKSRPASFSLRVDSDVWAEVEAIVYWSSWTLTLLVEYALSVRLKRAVRRGGYLVDPYSGGAWSREPGEAYPPTEGNCPPGPVTGAGPHIEPPSRTTLRLKADLVEAWQRHVYWSPPHSAREAVTAALREAVDLINASPQVYKRGVKPPTGRWAGRIKPPGESFPPIPVEDTQQEKGQE